MHFQKLTFMSTFGNANIMDYFDTHNISLQKIDIYADFFEYTHTGGPKNQIYSEIVGSVHYFGIELPHITLFLRHGGDFVGYLFGG